MQKHDHSKLFRKGIDQEECTRHREETSIRIRKNKRAEMIRKRRTRVCTPIPNMNLNVNLQLLYTGSDEEQLQTLMRLRKILSMGQEPPIQQVLDTNILPRLISYLGRHDNYHLQFEAAWILTNIASGETSYTQSIINANGMAPLIALLDTPHEDVKEQVVWALGNIMGDCNSFRDHGIQHGVVPAILRNFKPQIQRISTTHNMIWTISNICRGKPSPPLDIIMPVIPHLASVLKFDEEDILSDTCWALCYITDGENERIESVVKTGVCMRLVELITAPSTKVKIPALRTIGNIATGSDHLTQHIIDSGAINVLRNQLDCQQRQIRKESIWTLSNIAAGSQQQIQQLIDCKVIPKIIRMSIDEEFSIRKEALWTLANVTSGGTESQVEYLVHNGCLESFNSITICNDTKITQVALEALENILKCGEKERRNRSLQLNPYVEPMETIGVIESLEDLQEHQDMVIYNHAIRLLENYFGAEAETDTTAVTTTQPVFNFATGFQ
jgi:importin subunit alpha-1